MFISLVIVIEHISLWKVVVVGQILAKAPNSARLDQNKTCSRAFKMISPFPAHIFLPNIDKIKAGISLPCSCKIEIIILQ